MQLAVSLTSYKNTIHIFKVTYSRYWISFYFCFRKAANSECITLQEMSVFPNLLTLLFFWRYFIRQKYCCFMLWLFQNVEDWQKPRPPHLHVLLVPLGWPMLAPWSGVTRSSVLPQCHLPGGRLWFPGDSNVIPRAWIWASSEKSVVQDHQIRKWNLAISVLRKRLLFPSVSLPWYPFSYSSLQYWGSGKNWAKEGIKTIVNNVSNGYPFPSLKCCKKFPVFSFTCISLLHYPTIGTPTSSQYLPPIPNPEEQWFHAFKVSYPPHSCSVNNRPI